jgi:hypothetical protein
MICLASWAGFDNYKKIWYNKKKTLLCRPAPVSGNFERICPDRFHQKKLPYVRTDRKLGLPRPRPALSIGSEAIWGCSECPLLKVEPNKCSDFGKKWKKSVHKKFTKNFSKRVDFLKIPAYSTIVGRTF